MLDPLYCDEVRCLLHDPAGTIRPEFDPPRVVLPGSFNPLHHGHVALADVACKRFAAPLAFELSIANVDKADLSRDEVLRRLEQFRGRWPVFITRAARIEEKAAVFPGCIFVVGADTAARIVHPRYYRNDPADLARALDVIRGFRCRFLVGGRIDDDGRFVDVDGVAIPAGYRDLFVGLSESEFRIDISSTQIRRLA
jgi:hypothetical protein